MRDFTPEEKELIINTPITIECFDVTKFTYSASKEEIDRSIELLEGVGIEVTVTISKEEYFGMLNELSNLRNDNERFKAERDVLMHNAKEIIAQFYCWYISSNSKRDLSRIEEGRNEAQQFLDDLVFEVSGVEK